MYQLEPIGYIHSCFKEKFAIPRQPLLAPAATGIIELLPPYNQSEALVGLEQVSHLWLLFIFHQTIEEKPRLKVRPPRLGGNKSLGVFATRSTYRPNNIGQSVVKLEQIIDNQLYVSGIDLVDGTPIIDIKPYIPYADIVTEATNTIAPVPPLLITVIWSEQALTQVVQQEKRLQKPLQTLITQSLSQDPRPAYQQPEPTREYGTVLWDVNIKWHYPDLNTIEVLVVSHQLIN